MFLPYYFTYRKKNKSEIKNNYNKKLRTMAKEVSSNS